MIDIKRTMIANAPQQIEDMSILLFEGEAYAHRFLIAPPPGISFSGCEVTARFVRADHQNVAVGGSVSSQGEACVVLTPACYAVPGYYKLFIYVVSNQETVCVYACTGPVQATVGANGSAGEIPEPIIESYGGGSGDSRYRFEGGPNGTYTKNGVTITNDGRLYTLSGTGDSTGLASIAVLDGCVNASEKEAVAHLKKGHSYRFSMQVSKYPTYQSDGETLNDYSAFVLYLMKGDSTVLLNIHPTAAAYGSPLNVNTYYCEQDEDVWLRLAITCGKSVSGELQGYNMAGIKVLVGFGETDGTEVGQVNKNWTYYGDTKMKVAPGRTLTIGSTTLSEAQLQALLALIN